MGFNIWKKGCIFSPIESQIGEDFGVFSRRMRVRCKFRDETSEDFSHKYAFGPKYKWKPPPGHPSLELLLSELEKEIFNDLLNDSLSILYHLVCLRKSALRGLADDRSIVIKQADIDSRVAV